MPVIVGTAGGNKEVPEILVGAAGGNKQILKGWVGTVGGNKVFFEKVSIPENLIVFFPSTPGGTWIVQDSGGTVDLCTNQIYPRGGSAQGGSEAGANTHQHSTYSGNTGSVNEPAAYNPQTFTDIYLILPHVHTMGHLHIAVNHEPSYYTLIPAAGGKTIPSGGILFWDGSAGTIPTGWQAKAALYDKYIKCKDAAGATGGTSNHSHAHTGNSNTITARRTKYWIGSGANIPMHSSAWNHLHSISHTHVGGQNEPEYYGLIPIEATEEISEITSGICGWFIGSSVPNGWTLHGTIKNGKFVKCKAAAGSSGGVNSHGHSYSGNSGPHYHTGVPNNTGTTTVQLTHTHAISHDHDTKNNIPLHRVLMMCKKD